MLNEIVLLNDEALSSKNFTVTSTRKWYNIANIELTILGLTFSYYFLMIICGVICWFVSKRKFELKKNCVDHKIWSRFEISPHQLHIKYTDGDEDSMSI